MKLKKSKLLVLASVALFVFGVAGKTEAASPDKQIELLAKQTAVWGADQFYRDWQKDGGYCAVTDLDGNGRLELFFVRGVRNPVPGANENGSNEEKGRALVATVPITMRVRGFEVSADGKKLEELKFNYPDKIVPPNLHSMQEAFYNDGDKIRFYNVATLNRVGDLGFCLYRQVLSLKNGIVEVQTIGTEYGNYGLFNEAPTAEAIFDHAEDRYGKQMNEAAMNDYVKMYAAGAIPADFKMKWIYPHDWQKAQKTPGGIRDAFAESWKEFKFEVKKK
ncbi:MAG: hypothetical protein IKZ43_06020 [Acidaminococcaceae bacterium]|nr:hypothetical protein [Acidaminococcaceae bacterium]